MRDAEGGLRPFHLAVPVDDLGAARRFYGGVLGLKEGRSSERWIDFDFGGHQFVVHRVERGTVEASRNPVDGDRVPVPHFGIVLRPEAFEALVERLRDADWPIEIGPRRRFEGRAGEQWTLFLRDPAGNALEFKAFRDDRALFASDPDAPPYA
ncbi:MAG: VOC family protein [Planctomycetota bacterium]